MNKENIQVLANNALNKITKSKKECVDRIIGNTNEMNIYGAINILLSSVEEGLIFAENQYLPESNGKFKSKINNFVAFDSATSAKLFDALEEMFGGSNINDIFTIIRMVEGLKKFNY